MQRGKTKFYTPQECYGALIDFFNTKKETPILNKVCRYLYKEIYDSFYNKAVSIFKHEGVAEDELTKFFYLYIFEKIDLWQPKGNFISWLKKCIYQKMLERLRYKDYQLHAGFVPYEGGLGSENQDDFEVVENEGEYISEFGYDEINETTDKNTLEIAMQEVVKQLNTFEQSCVNALYYDDHKIKEFAAEHDTKAQNIYILLNKIKLKMLNLIPKVFKKYGIDVPKNLNILIK